ncbi:MAG TPA: FAD-binding oxidoreductase [Streptosporangiaceae bacterium]|jgi:FAD/FMN-containing dehydrogenase
MTSTFAPPASTILTAADPGWDEARQAWNLAVDQQPAAIACPASAPDVMAAVNYARRHGLRVAAQGTGHNAAPLGPLSDSVLIKTDGMRRVTIDPRRMTARAEAGAVWQDVTDATADHGLAALAGSSPNVGVTGYTTGGGLSWLGRAYGLSANNVEAFEVVTADGRLVRADAAQETDLFWALRGGGGSFGVVTAAELRLFPVTEVCAGLLWWPVEAAAEVLQAWRELTQRGLPDEFSTAARLMRFPALPQIPEPVRGGSFVVIDAFHLGSEAEAADILAPLRALRPVTDTVHLMPARDLGQVHLDPPQPTPGVGDGVLLDILPAVAIDGLVQLAGPGADTPLLVVELRQLGGEMRWARPGNGALAMIDAGYALFAGGLVTSPESATAITRDIRAIQAAMAPWAARQMYLNFAETRRDPATFWTPQAYTRLRQIKAAVDPEDRIRSNHPIPPAAAH